MGIAGDWFFIIGEVAAIALVLGGKDLSPSFFPQDEPTKKRITTQKIYVVKFWRKKLGKNDR